MVEKRVSCDLSSARSDVFGIRLLCLAADVGVVMIVIVSLLYFRSIGGVDSFKKNGNVNQK